MREGRQTEILLIGNPNAGKSTLFNALTGGNARVGNWHGVTVGALEKRVTIGEENLLICDLPGVYSLDGFTMEEKGAEAYLKLHGDAFLLFVAECAHLSRSIALFEKLSKNRRCALVITKRRPFEKAGGFIDLLSLERELKIPVFCAENSKKALNEWLISVISLPKGQAEWRVSQASYRPARAQLSPFDKLLTNAFFTLPLFALLIGLTFYITFAPNLLGDFLSNQIEEFFTGTLSARAQAISSPVLRGFLVDGILSGVGGVACFLPQIALLYLSLIFMEESGFLSRLAYLTDGFFRRIGLSGRAVFSLLMGFGCTATAIMTTRGLEDKKMQKRVILSLPYLSCSAKLPVFLTLSSGFFANPFYAVLILYALGVGICVGVAYCFRQEQPPFLLELAPLQVPSVIFTLKSLYFQLKQFIIKLATVILAFFLLSWALSSFTFSLRYCAVEESMLATLCGGFAYLFAPIGCCDWKIAYSAFSGLIAKENVAGALALFYGGFPYPAESAFAFSCFILTCSPCVSAIVATAKELGWKRAILYALAQTGSALLFSYLVYFLLRGGAVFALLALVLIFAIYILGSRTIEKVHRKRTNHAEKFYR